MRASVQILLDTASLRLTLEYIVYCELDLVTLSHTNCNRSWKIVMQSFYTRRQSCKRAYASILYSHIYANRQRQKDCGEIQNEMKRQKERYQEKESKMMLFCIQLQKNFNILHTLTQAHNQRTRYQNTLPNGIQTLFHTIN